MWKCRSGLDACVILYQYCLLVFYGVSSFSSLILVWPLWVRGPGSSVCIATGYGLDGPRIKTRWGTRFSAPDQTGPGTHPASCTMGTGSIPGVKRGRGVTLTPHSFWCCGHERVELYLYSPYGPYGLYIAFSACTRVHFYSGFESQKAFQPKLLIVLSYVVLVCKYVLYCCHRVSNQL